MRLIPYPESLQKVWLNVHLYNIKIFNQLLPYAAISMAFIYAEAIRTVTPISYIRLYLYILIVDWFVCLC